MKDLISELNANGVLLDWDRFAELEEEAVISKSEAFNNLNSLLPYPLGEKDMANDTLAPALYRNNLFPQDISFEYFKESRAEHPAYECIYKYKKAGQRMALLTNIRKCRAEDDRIRGLWRADSSRTKRLGCCRPNLMSLPKAVKECVIPDTGKVIIQCDYSQIELRILAEITQDNVLLETFKNGGDVHATTAALLWDKPVEDIAEDERTAAKSINYGIIYGMSARGLRDDLIEKGLRVTLSQAAALRNRFLDVFPGVKMYQHTVSQADKLFSLGGTEIVTENMSIPQRLNWPIQTSCSEVLLFSLHCLMEHKDSSTKIINAIHDEIWIEVDGEKIDTEKECLTHSMEIGFNQYVHTLPYAGDVTMIKEVIKT